MRIMQRESVDLAMQLLDESDLRGSKLDITLAEFKMKGDFDPKLRRKPKNNKAKRKEKEKGRGRKVEEGKREGRMVLL